MAWLLRDGEVLASLEIARSRRDRRRGLLGRDGLDGALLLAPGRSVHTFGMRFAIDVAVCDGSGTVLKSSSLPPGRLTAPVWRGRSVIEAEAGMFERWRLTVGDVVEFAEQRPAGNR